MFFGLGAVALLLIHVWDHSLDLALLARRFLVSLVRGLAEAQGHKLNKVRASGRRWLMLLLTHEKNTMPGAYGQDKTAVHPSECSSLAPNAGESYLTGDVAGVSTQRG